MQFHYKYVEKSSFRLRHYNVLFLFLFGVEWVNTETAWYKQSCLTTEIHFPTLSLSLNEKAVYYQRMKTLEQINGLRPCTELSM